MVVAQLLSLQQLVQVSLHQALHNVSAQMQVKITAVPSWSSFQLQLKTYVWTPTIFFLSLVVTPVFEAMFFMFCGLEVTFTCVMLILA